MSQIVYDNILASLYLLVWIVTFVVLHRKHRRLDAMSAIMLMYIIYNVFSLLTINDPLFSMTFEPLTVFPYIYLYMMLMVALSPAIYFHNNEPKGIEYEETRVMKPFCWMVIICAVIIIPDIVGNFNEGIVKLFTDSDAGKDAYSEQLSEASDKGSSISNIPSVIFNASYDLILFFFFYYLTQEKKDVPLLLGLSVCLVIGVLQPVMYGQRTGVINGILTIFAAYMMFRQFINKKLAKSIEVIGMTGVVLAILPVAAITFSRFGTTNAGVMGFLNWYVGQGSIYFNNYGLDAGGIRYGDRILNLFKRVIDPSTPKNYIERRMKYHNLDMDDDRFTTFVGDFCIEFGPILTVVIFILFAWYILRNIKYSENGKIKTHQLMLLYFTICVCMQGGMYLFAYADTGNLRIIVLFAFVYYLKLHEKLLLAFPKREYDGSKEKE